MYKPASNSYSQVGAQEILQASPYRIIQMLMEAALGHFIKAKIAIENDDPKTRLASISKAFDIILELQRSLNFDEGDGKVANNLNDLYEFMGMHMMKANLDNDPVKLDEVIHVMREIKTGWDGAGDKLKAQASNDNGL